MFKYVLFILSIFLFSGCSNHTPNYSTKEFTYINKDAVLKAAKRVINLSDDEFIIHSTRNNIEATKIIAKNRGMTVDIQIHTIELNTTQENNNTTATLIIKNTEDYFDKNDNVVINTSHKLFWDRVDYILGLKDNWPTCAVYRTKLNYDGIFCDIAYNKNLLPKDTDIIKDIGLDIKEVIEKNIQTLVLANIDMSLYDTLQLPIVQTNETEITIASIDTSNIFDLNISISPSLLDINSTDINKTITPILIDLNITDKNTTIIPDLNITKKIEIKKPEPEENNNLTGFAKEFMEADPKTIYTINLALIPNLNLANKFMSKYNIKDNSFAIEFGKKNKRVKIMYGLFSSRKEALTAIKNMPKALKSNSPTVEGVGRKQSLYKTNDVLKSSNIYNKKKVKKVPIKKQSIVKSDIKEINLNTQNIEVEEE